MGSSCPKLHSDAARATKSFATEEIMLHLSKGARATATHTRGRCRNLSTAPALVDESDGHSSVCSRCNRPLLSRSSLLLVKCRPYHRLLPESVSPPGQDIQAKASPAAKLPQPRPEALQAFADIPAPSTQLNPKGAPSRRNDVDGSPHRISSSFSIPRFLRRKFLLTCLVLSTVDCRHHH
jgi:hypothetical protein